MRHFVIGLMILGSPILAFAGGSSDGGGNAIQCDDGKVYAWDYQNAKLDLKTIDPVFLNAKSADEIINEIIHRLIRKNHEMATSLYDFHQFNRDPLAEKKRLWIYGINPLINLNDEDRTQIPLSCLAHANPDFKLFQAVIRQQDGNKGRIIYQVDQNIMQRLAGNSPLQVSFLYVHEWLRDYSANPQDIVIVDQLLHGSEIYKLDAKHFAKILRDYRMDVRESIFDQIPTGPLHLFKNPRSLSTSIFDSAQFIFNEDTSVTFKGKLRKTIPSVDRVYDNKKNDWVPVLSKPMTQVSLGNSSDESGIEEYVGNHTGSFTAPITGVFYFPVDVDLILWPSQRSPHCVTFTINVREKKETEYSTLFDDQDPDYCDDTH